MDPCPVSPSDGHARRLARDGSRDTQYDFPVADPAWLLQLCPTVYGVNLNRIDTMVVPSHSKCTTEDLCDEKSWKYRPLALCESPARS